MDDASQLVCHSAFAPVKLDIEGVLKQALLNCTAVIYKTLIHYFTTAMSVRCAKMAPSPLMINCTKWIIYYQAPKSY